jgi:2-dehydro-3-deoxyphosphooctonate aldolase (KDO 8-P synthase)
MAVIVEHITIGGGAPLVLFAGPCVVETREITLHTAERVKSSADKYRIPAVFKSSYKKANRTSGGSFTGLEMDKALAILSEVKRDFGLPILTDIHTENEANVAAEVADILQIPAFLCRQTELLHAAARTGKAVNIKKGQFVAPGDMKFAAEKVTNAGNRRVLLTERGTTFGYHNLIVDMRSLKIMRDLGFPVIFDATHSVQLPSKNSSGSSSGTPEFILPLARAAVAAGCDGLFLEVHPDPPRALSDAGSQLNLDLLDEVLLQVTTLDEVVRGFAMKESTQ